MICFRLVILFLFGTSLFLSFGQAASIEEEFIRKLPRDIKHGYLRVNDGRKIFFYGRFVNKRSLKSDPVVFVNGGPGLASHSFGERIVLLEKFKDQTIVFFDQRGTGLSALESSVESLDEETVLRDYGSSAIVEDIFTIKRNLFPDSKISLVGHSFGAVIAAKFSNRYPDSVSSLHLVSFAFHNMPQKLMEYRYLGQELITSKYLNKYPEDLEQIATLKKSISQSFCFNNVCGKRVLDLLLSQRIHLQEKWEELHDLITKLISGAEVDYLYLRQELKLLDINGNGEKGGIGFLGEVVVQRELVGKDNFQLARNRLESKGVFLPDWVVDTKVASDGINTDLSQKDIEGLPQSRDFFSLRDLEKTLDLIGEEKVFFYSGIEDEVVPPNAFDYMKERISKDKFQMLEHLGHIDVVFDDGLWSKILVEVQGGCNSLLSK